MTILKTYLFRPATIGIAAITIFFAACAKDTYEEEIQRFYFENTKSSVKVSRITVDTTVSFEQARPWLEKKLERVKERLKVSYNEEYNRLRTEGADAAQVARWKAKADSANAGLFSANNHEIKAFSAFINEKPMFEQVTLRYKVWVQGEVMEQIFIRKVTATDTTLSVTEKGVKEYLSY